MFFGVGYMYFLISMSMNEIVVLPRAFTKHIPSGIYNEWNSSWYGDVGKHIIEISLSYIPMPIFEFFGNYFIRHIKRMIDQQKLWPNDMSKTRVKTVLQFVEMYQGPPFIWSHKYA